MPSCPVCGQALADPRAAARVEANLQKLRDAEHKKHARELAEAKASAQKEAREAATKARRDAEAQHRAKLEDERRRYRAEVEKAKADARTAEQQRSSREIEMMRRQLAEQQRRLEKLSADERGEIGEAELLERLRREFPGDKIERLGKGRGSADIRHEVVERGQTCGVIIYECKNVKDWSNAYVEQARKSRTLHKASHAVLVSTAFPKNAKYLCFVRDVPVVHGSIVTSVVRCLRQELAVRAGTGGTAADRERRADRLLQYVKGEEFIRQMTIVADSMVDLRSIQSKERSAHLRIWEQQAQVFEQLESAHTKISTRVDSIVAGATLAAVPQVAAS